MLFVLNLFNILKYTLVYYCKSSKSSKLIYLKVSHLNNSPSCNACLCHSIYSVYSLPLGAGVVGGAGVGPGSVNGALHFLM